VHEVVVSALAVVSDCRDAASAVLPLHVMLVVFFFVIHNADASSPHIDPHASGRSPHTWRMCSVAYVGTHVLTERGSPEFRNIIHHPSAAEQLASSLPLAQ